MLDMNAKLAVDVGALSALLEKAGYGDQIAGLETQVDGGYFGTVAERNRWIILLACESDTASFDEIAICFGASPEEMGITRAAITHVLNQCGKTAIRKKNRRQKALEHLQRLESPAGRAQTERVMQTAARDLRFWFIKRGAEESWRRLNRSRVLEALGFEPLHTNLTREIWRRLREGNIVEGDKATFVAVRYGLGEKDPPDYVATLYHDDNINRRIADVVELINERLAGAGLLPLPKSALVYFMKRAGIAFKNRGHGLEHR